MPSFAEEAGIHAEQFLKVYANPTTTPRDLLINMLADAIGAHADVQLGNSVTANSYASGRIAAYAASSARLVAMLYGGDYEATLHLAIKRLEDVGLSWSDADLKDAAKAGAEADIIATALIDAI